MKKELKSAKTGIVRLEAKLMNFWEQVKVFFLLSVTGVLMIAGSLLVILSIASAIMCIITLCCSTWAALAIFLILTPLMAVVGWGLIEIGRFIYEEDL